MYLRLGRSSAASSGAAHSSRRFRWFVAFSAVLTAVAVVSSVFMSSASATIGEKPTLTKLVDANADGIFNATENVPKTVSYPWTVGYQLTIDAGTFNHKIVAITDSTTTDIGTCAALIGTTVLANTSVSCTYAEPLAAAGTEPFVNTADLTYDSAGGDVLSDAATVNFPGMSLVKSSTTTQVTTPGQVIPYSYLITNTGTSELTGVSLVDNNTDSAPSCPATTLAVGASMTCTGQHTVSITEFVAGGYIVNVATASSNEAPDAKDELRIPIIQNMKTGALTIGFWQNKNGQGIISGGASTAGVCNSGTWLRQYAPFANLSSTANCAGVASYVMTVIKAATCGGATCNAMLKAQMLATALNVFFSDPALGGNKIGAPAPIGGDTILLVNWSSAFGGATSLTVSQMLTYAASQSNVGGTTWYSNVKATQVLAKDAFDAINNQTALLV
jgi:hypothetical protein